MNPILLQKQVRDNTKELQDFYKELKEWGDTMKRKDKSYEPDTPQVPSSSKIQKTQCVEETINEPKTTEHKRSKRIPSYDYKSWEKFDADAHCAKLDKEDNNEPSSDESELSSEFDESLIDLANSEKEKGNSFVKKQRWDDAIKCYTRAIESYAYNPIYYANRALCYLKRENYRNAESDCTTALQLDKTYVKAYQRRAAAREYLNQLKEAHDDLLKVLELEPNNTESKAALVKLEGKLNIKPPVTDTQRPLSKFTMSRSKHKQSQLHEIKAEFSQNKPEEVPVMKSHIVENVCPSTATNSLSSEENINTKNVVHVRSEKNLKETHWPSGNNVELFKSALRPRNSVRIKPLRRIDIVDVDLETATEQQSEPKEILASQSNKEYDKFAKIKETDHGSKVEKAKLNLPPSVKSNVIERIETDNQTKTKNASDGILEIQSRNMDKEINSADSLYSENKYMQEVKNEKKQSNFEVLNLPIPKTSVQFYNGWKMVQSKQNLRYAYLKRINSEELPLIFKESLESKIFSEIIETLTVADDNTAVYNYLLHMANVKRFSALVMFMDAMDRKCMLKLIDRMREDNKFTNADIDVLVKKYEM